MTEEERTEWLKHNVVFQCWCPDKGEPKTMNSCGWGFSFDIPKDRLKDIEAFASVAIDENMAKREEFRRGTFQSFESPSVVLVAEWDRLNRCVKRKGIRMKFRKDTLTFTMSGGRKASTYSYSLVA